MTDSTNTVMPVAPMCGTSGNGNGGMWGGDWSAWIVLFLIFGMFGYGGNGWGFGGGGASGQNVRDGYVLTSDFANIERKMDLIQGEQCTGFANVNQGLATGFAGVQTSFANAEIARANMQATMTDQLYNLGISQQTQFNNGQIAMMQGFNSVQSNTQNGFNGIQQTLAQTNYNMAQQGCDTRNTIQSTTRDIIDSQTCGTRAILDALNAQSIEQKNERIAELTNQNNALRLAASQQAQNAYLVNELRPCPIPAYIAPNPYCCTPQNTCGCGCSGNYA